MLSVSAPVASVSSSMLEDVPCIPMGEMAAALNVSSMPSRAKGAKLPEQVARWLREGYALLGEFNTWWAAYEGARLGLRVAQGWASATEKAEYRRWWPSEVRRQTATDMAFVLFNALPESARCENPLVYIETDGGMDDGCVYRIPVPARDVEMFDKYATRIKAERELMDNAIVS